MGFFDTMGLGQFSRSGQVQPPGGPRGYGPPMQGPGGGAAGIMAPRQSAEDQRLMQDPAFQQQYGQWVMSQGPGAGDWATPTGYQQWRQNGGQEPVATAPEGSMGGPPPWMQPWKGGMPWQQPPGLNPTQQRHLGWQQQRGAMPLAQFSGGWR